MSPPGPILSPYNNANPAMGASGVDSTTSLPQPQFGSTPSPPRCFSPPQSLPRSSNPMVTPGPLFSSGNEAPIPGSRTKGCAPPIFNYHSPSKPMLQYQQHQQYHQTMQYISFLMSSLIVGSMYPQTAYNTMYQAPHTF